MAIPRFFQPVPELDNEERRRGLGNMTRQAMAAAGADGLASGGFLASFALILGASNFHIGIMTAIPFIMQPLQLVDVLAVERLRLRKAVAVTAYFFAYTTWIPIALLPFLVDVPNPTAVTLMLVFIALRGVGNTFVNTSWNGWLLDLVPQDLMGKFFAQRVSGGRRLHRQCQGSLRPSTSTGGRRPARAMRSSPIRTRCCSAASFWDSVPSGSWRACRSHGWSSPQANAPRCSAAWGHRSATGTSGS